MKRLFPLIGLLLAPLTVGAAEVDLYARFRDQVAKEYGTVGVSAAEVFDTPVLEFLMALYPQWNLTESQAQEVASGSYWLVCGEEDVGVNERSECTKLGSTFSAQARLEQRLRMFGRTMQRIAISQELPLSEIPGRPFHLTTDLSGIINIWAAGTGSIKTQSGAVRLRTIPLEEGTRAYDATKTAIEEFSTAYDALNEEEQVALVARYQYGVRLIGGERAPDFPPPTQDAQSTPGSERQYLFKRWQEIEQSLMEAWKTLPLGDTLNPPLSSNDAAYVLLPEELSDALPENVLLWFRVGPYTANGKDMLGDVGVQFLYPLEPFLPSLVSSADDTEPILGGRYPPEPVDGEEKPIDGRGLCSMALARRGYLCRPLQATQKNQCPDTTVADNSIALVSCTVDEEPRLTVAGADVCREITWQKDSTPACETVAVRCSTCSDLAPPRPEGGTVDACIPGELSDARVYGSIAGLVRAQQACSPSASDTPYTDLPLDEALPVCCRIEGEAYRAACDALEQDGAFMTNSNGEQARIVVDGVELDAQTCGEILTQDHCKLLGEQEDSAVCPAARTYSFETNVGLRNAIERAGSSAAYSCTTDTAAQDPRVRARTETIKRADPVCTPGTETQYKNTIGNNACYIGTCVEESLENHRITGGRTPATVGDAAFPFDDPATGDPLTTVLRSAAISAPALPSYRPQAVARILEDALCQLQGMPSASPPHLCAFSTSKRLAVPLANDAATARSLTLGIEEQIEATLETEQLAAALGSRIGTDIQGQYLRISTRTLSQTITVANTLLKDMLEVGFPAEMCPLAPAQ